MSSCTSSSSGLCLDGSNNDDYCSSVSAKKMKMGVELEYLNSESNVKDDKEIIAKLDGNLNLMKKFNDSKVLNQMNDLVALRKVALQRIYDDKSLLDVFHNFDSGRIIEFVNEKFSECSVTLLHLAVSFECEIAVKDLISLGADVNASDRNKNTPLHLARNVNMVDLLLGSGAKIDVKNIDGQNVLSSAFIDGDFNMVEFLLKAVNDETFKDALKCCQLPANFTRTDFMSIMFDIDF